MNPLVSTFTIQHGDQERLIMQDINYSFEDLLRPISTSENNHGGRSWSPSPQPTYRATPPRQPVHPSLPPCSEVRQLPLVQSIPSPFNLNITQPTPTRNPNRSPPYLDVPNFPLPRPYQNSPNLERPNEGGFVLYSQETGGSPLQVFSLETSSSKGVTPVSRPVSRLSWHSGGSSASNFPSWPPQTQEGFIDLTADSSPPIMVSTSRKRPSSVPPNSSAGSTSPLNQKKKRKVGESPMVDEFQEVDQVDLREVDDDDGLAKVLEQQRLASIKSQQEQVDKPVTFSTIQCIICMEPMTNVTVTHCGECPKSSNIYSCSSVDMCSG